MGAAGRVEARGRGGISTNQLAGLLALLPCALLVDETDVPLGLFGGCGVWWIWCVVDMVV